MTWIDDPKDSPYATGDTGCVQVSNEDLCASTLEHYERLATIAHEWNNQVPQAIKAWYASKAAASIPSASVSSWISVKDRLPEKDGTYFVLKDGDATCEANTTPWYKGEWIWNDGSIIRLTDPELQVEFWMPIPEKPNAIQ